MSGGFETVLEVVVWTLLIAAATTDLLWGKIYNLLTFTFIAAGVILRLIVLGYSSATVSLIAIAAAFALFFPLYIIKAFAAGDVKLLMAIGAWTDIKQVLHIGLLAIIIGALVGIPILIKRRGLKKSVKAVASQLKGEPVKPIRMPFGPAFLCAFAFLKIAEMKGWINL